jgi:hypothetical protein
LSRISRLARRSADGRRRDRVTVRASLVLVLSAIASVGGAGPSVAAADVFTNFSLPTITGSAVEGQTLSEGHARWSTPPAAYAYQWQRCNSAGSDCNSIPKARAQTYLLTAADVGFTIRVAEDARNAEGAVTPSVSEPTAGVQAATSGGHGEEGKSGGGGSPGSCCSQPTQNGAAHIKALLTRQLAPTGKGASISAVLRHAGLRASFKLPAAGGLVVRWYLISPGAKRALVAVGQAKLVAGKAVTVSIKLTAVGKTLFKRARKAQLEVTGVFTPKGAAAIKAARKLSLKR